MPHALLLRHGQYFQPQGVPSAHLPYGLTAEGEAQIRASVTEIASHIGRDGLRLTPTIWSSHLPRARQSASLLAQGLSGALKLKLQVSTTWDLAERGLGAFANLTVEEIEECLVRDYEHPRPTPSWKRDPHFKLPGPGAESLAEAGARVLRFIDAHTPATPALTIYVGHGGAFRHCSVQMGILSIDEAKQLTMSHGGYVILQKNGGWRQCGGSFKARETRRFD